MIMKVEIRIKHGNYADMNYMSKTYGGCSPCDTPDEIKNAIKWARERIIKEGDKPVLVDERESAKLTAWGFK